MDEKDYITAFNSLEDSFGIDGKETELINWAKNLEDQYNGAVKAASHDEDAMGNLLNSLQMTIDREFSLYKYAHRDVAVSGVVTESRYDPELNTFNDASVEYTQRFVSVNGYTLSVHNDDDGTPVSRISYRFDTKSDVIHRQIGATRDTVTKQYAIAPIGTVEVLGSDFGVDRLDDVAFYHPEIVSDIKGYIEASKNETELLRHLSTHKVPGGGAVSRESLDTLKSYVAYHLNFDTELPYGANLQGALMTGDRTQGGPSTINYVENEATTIVSPIAVILERAPEYDRDPVAAIKEGAPYKVDLSEDLYWQLVISRYPDDREKEQEILTVPLSTIKGIYPLRGLNLVIE